MNNNNAPKPTLADSTVSMGDGTGVTSVVIRRGSFSIVEKRKVPQVILVSLVAVFAPTLHRLEEEARALAIVGSATVD